MLEVTYKGELRTSCLDLKSGALIDTAAPIDNKGTGDAFSPTDLLLASAASCALTLMGIRADMLKVSLQGLKAKASKEMQLSPRRVGSMKIEISCESDFDAAIKEKLEDAAKTCPVHRSLHPDISLEMTFFWGQK